MHLDFEGMGSPGAPCWETNTYVDRCYWRIELEHRSAGGIQVQDHDQGYLYANDSATGHSPNRTRSGSGTLAPVTHAVVELYGAYGTGLGSNDDPYVFEILVADPLAAVEHSEATAAEIEAAMGFEDGDVPDEAVQGLITALAVQDDAEIILALGAAPFTRANGSSLNDGQLAFASMRAAGAPTSAALARVLRMAGGAALVAVGIGVVTADMLATTPEGGFPEPPDDPRKPAPPAGGPTFDPYNDRAPAAWVGTAEFDAAIEESRRVAEAVQVGVALLEDVCRQVLLGEIAAPPDVYDACQRFLVNPHPTLEDALRLLALGASDWEHHARIIDDLLAWATPLDYIEGEVAYNPFAPINNPWVPSTQHELALISCGLDSEALADMIEIARATNQWIRDHGGSVQLHRTSEIIDGESRLNDLGRAARVVADGWKVDYREDVGPIPVGYHASHLPDATVTGLPRTDYGNDGMELHRAEANTRVGSALGVRIQHGSGMVTVVTVDGQFVGTLDYPIEIERLC